MAAITVQSIMVINPTAKLTDPLQFEVRNEKILPKDIRKLPRQARVILFD